jgi:DNA-binding CsgD family transcriptional regulator
VTSNCRPASSKLEANRLKRENVKLKRMIGIVTLNRKEEKITIVKESNNKKLIGKCMGINPKYIYSKSIGK